MLDITQKPDRPLIAASILSADFGHIADECRDVLDRGADLLHIDVMDGHFVPNLTMGVDMIRGLRQHMPDAYLDVHLMVEKPGEYITSFAEAGADMFTFHLEVCTAMRPHGEDADSLIDRIRSAGMHAGLVVNPSTAIEPMAPYLDELDMVLIMSVNPGRSGQKFIPEVLDKVRWVKERIGEKTRLQIDGGLNPSTVQSAIDAGVDVIVSASALFGADDRSAAIAALRGK